MVAPPIQSARPYGESAAPAAQEPGADVYARLYQDPLGAAQSAYDALRGKSTTDARMVSFKKEQLFLTHKNSNEERLLIIPVMIPGARSPEAIETRMRARVAVLAGLGVSGFSPTKVESIGYFTLPWPEQDKTAPKWGEDGVVEASQKNRLVIPYDVCAANFGLMESTALEGSNMEHTLRAIVLWLADDQFKDHPLARLGILFKGLEIAPPKVAPTPGAGGTEEKPPTPVVRIIGPTDSTTLRSMVIEGTNGVPRWIQERLANTHIYAARPTVSDAIVTFNAGWQASDKSPDRNATHILEKAIGGNFKFFRTTPPDNLVAEELIKELALRQIDARNRDTHIAIISEWDSFYGRSLPITFAAGAMSAEGHTKIDELLGETFPREWDDHPIWNRIHRFHYMRGLDGRLPEDRRPAEKKEASGPSEAIDPVEKARMAQPEGRSQADSLLRLADQLEDVDRDLRHEQGSGLRAVGVLGSDIYDRLMVLTALRSRLPDAVFFTNTLDARLAHPSEWATTHNLVISAGFGLRLAEQYQRQVPPFRESHQTAMFATTLCITKVLPQSLGHAVPRRFEVGRAGLHDLSATESKLHPPRDMANWWNWRLSVRAWLIVLAALLLALLSARLVRGIGGGPIKAIWGRTTVVVASAALASMVATWFFYRWTLQGGAGEQFGLADGTSVWPSNALRIFALLLTLLFLIRGPREMRRNADEIEEHYALHAVRPAGFADLSDLLRAIKDLWRHFRGGPSDPSAQPPRPALREILVRLAAAMAPGGRDAGSATVGIARDGEWDVLTDEVPTLSSEGTPPLPAPTGSDRPVDVQKLWNQYLRRGSVFDRCERFLPGALVSFVLALIVIEFFGWPAVPARGDWSRFITIGIEIASSFFGILLLHYVVDATLLSRTFVEKLSHGDSIYPAATLEHLRKNRALQRDDLLADHLDIQLIAERTKAVSQLIFYPFIVLFILIVSRVNYFDDWNWPVGLVLVYSLLSGQAIFAGFTLRRCAERTRRESLVRLRDKLVSSLSRGDQPDVEIIRQTMGDIEALRTGAFAAFTQHPILAAILLPSGGLSIWVLLQNLPRPN